MVQFYISERSLIYLLILCHNGQTVNVHKHTPIEHKHVSILIIAYITNTLVYYLDFRIVLINDVYA